MAQLAERSLPISEVLSSNQVMCEFVFLDHLFTVGYIEKTKIKKKRPKIGDFKSIPKLSIV